MKENIRPIHLALLSNIIIIMSIPFMVLLDGNIFVIIIASLMGLILAISAVRKNIDREMSVRIFSTFGIVFNTLVMIGSIGIILFIGQLVQRMTA